jgi:hypothetical protein
MSYEWEEEYIPEPVVEYKSTSRVASWPITSLRALVSALNQMGCTMSKNSDLEALSRADSRLSKALQQLRDNSSHGNLQQTEGTIAQINEVVAAAEELRSAAEAADASRPKTIKASSSTGRDYELSLVAGSYVVQYEEIEVFVDGRLDRVQRDLEAREFVNELTHSYCIANEEHKAMVSDESMKLDRVSEDLRGQLRSATRIMDQWQRVQEITRIRNLIRERKEFLKSEAEKLGHRTEVHDFEDEVCLVIIDDGTKLNEIRQKEQESRIRGRGG